MDKMAAVAYRNIEDPNVLELLKRTEDDDYLLCLGSYTIRRLLERLEEWIGLNRDEIYFLKCDELKRVLDGREKKEALAIPEPGVSATALPLTAGAFLC